MTEHKKLKPEIRFAGFTDDWEQRKLEEFSKTTIGEFVIKTKQNPNSKYPVYNGGVSYTGFYDDFNNNGHKIIVSARGANAGFINIINGKYWAGNSCYSIDIQDNYCIEYVYHFMKHKQHLFTDFQQAANIPSVSKKDVEEFLISYPKSKEEQTQIGNFFKQLDDTIALHQREFEKFKILRKAYLKHIFIDNTTQFRAEKTIPWEQRKLGEFVSSLRSGLSRMLDSEDIGLPVIRANNINNGYVDLENDIKYWYQIDPMGANTRNYLVAKDDILINFINSESRMGSAAIMRSIPSRDTIYTTNILRLRLTSDLDPYWFYIQTQSKLYLEYIKSISKVAVNQASFTTVEFKNFTFFCPSTKEQTQIGNFFKQLDDTIALHQKELAKYQQIKTACLEKMFVE